MDKKRALICTILLLSCGGVALIAYLAGSVIIDVFPPKYRVFLPVMFTMFFLAGLGMAGYYLYLRKKESDRNVPEPPRFSADELAEWLRKFERFVRFGAKLTKTDSNKGFTKFGGLPQVPPEFVWPSYRDRAMPFLFQVAFSEINKDGKLRGFPRSGLLYVFVDRNEIYDFDEEEYLQGKTFEFLFFEKADKLITPTKPNKIETIYREFFVEINTVKTYPDVDDCHEAFDIYCASPVGGMDDEYDELQDKNLDAFMVGGWPTYIQSSPFADYPNIDADKWVLLMQIASTHDDEDFMWGDNGTLYFFIKKDDLRARNFGNVKLRMQFY